MKVLRFFKCGLTGEECAIAWNGKEEICITRDEAYDIIAQEQEKHDEYQLRGF